MPDDVESGSLSAVLKDRRSRLITSWGNRIASAVASSMLPRAELLDHIPAFIDELIRALHPSAVPLPPMPATAAVRPARSARREPDRVRPRIGHRPAGRRGPQRNDQGAGPARRGLRVHHRPGRLGPRNPATVAPESALDVEDVIAEAILLQKEAIDQARCAVTVTRKPGLKRAQGVWNRGCLLRIFCNLLQNATKYAPAAPVRVQLARAGDRLRIVFADRGPGISVRAGETAGKYLDDGLTPTGSHGLGLWIVRRGVAELNGSLKIRNAPGVGLAFAIELPGLC